jgi:hypothetical protein
LFAVDARIPSAEVYARIETDEGGLQLPAALSDVLDYRRSIDARSVLTD